MNTSGLISSLLTSVSIISLTPFSAISFENTINFACDIEKLLLTILFAKPTPAYIFGASIVTLSTISLPAFPPDSDVPPLI